MNPVQLAIVAIIGIIILILIGYFWYQEIKFKKMVGQNFNQKTEDVIHDNQSLVLDGLDVDTQFAVKKNILIKDIEHNKEAVDNIEMLFGNHHTDTSAVVEKKADTVAVKDFPEDSMEAVFAKIKKLPFPYNNQLNENLDYVVNMAFEKPIKIKVLPDIASLTQKHFKIYILTDDSNWLVYEKGHKYTALGLKIVINLVDKNGLINQAQISNIYKELFKFTMHYEGFIEQSDFEESLSCITEQVKYLPDMKLELLLYIILKDTVDYIALANFFRANHFTEIDGKFIYIQNGITEFMVVDENNEGFKNGLDYGLLRIISPLHFMPQPLVVIEAIMDFSERMVQKFEARLLTTNRQVFTEREYNTLIKYVNSYINNAEKYKVELGGALVRRLL